MPPDSEGKYFIARLGGREVAGVGSTPQAAPPMAMWNTYVWVESADETAAKVEALGGTALMPPFDVFTHGRMFVLKDPTGATISVWQAKEHSGIELVGVPGTICWCELATPDAQRAGAFFSNLFGWSLKAGGGEMNYTELVNGTQPIGGIMPMAGDMWQGVPPHWMAYFMVADCDATARKAWELGGKLCVEPQDIPNVGRFSVITDPQGAVFSIIQLGGKG